MAEEKFGESDGNSQPAKLRVWHGRPSYSGFRRAVTAKYKGWKPMGLEWEKQKKLKKE